MDVEEHARETAMFRVLAIDGGGIRGVIPAVLLSHLETVTGKPTAELFDLIVGTSTGGIIAMALSSPADNGGPRYSAGDVLGLYADHGREIFQRSFWKGVVSVAGTLDERYDAAPLERLLKRYLGDVTLADCLTPVVAASYDIERREPYFFKTRKARRAKDRNHYLRDAARATSAAPTYFEPAVTRSLAAKGTRRVLIDGGVFVNNPAMSAFSEACAMGAAPGEIVLASLGTGIATRPIPYRDAKDWGTLNWARPIISVMMDGQADAAGYHLRLLLPDVTRPDEQRYFRFDRALTLALDDLDAASAGNIRNLEQEAGRILEDQAEELHRLAALLG